MQTRTTTERPHPLSRFFAGLALAAGIVAVDVLRGVEPASAADYPSWEDVIAARASESTKQAEVQRIQGLIAQLESEAQAAQELAMQKADEYSLAQEAYDTAVYRADELARQTDEARMRAEESNKQAGMLITQFTRAGGADLTLNLIVAGEATDDLLYQLGAMSQLTQKTGALYEQATQDRNTADALGAQALVAEAELEGLKLAAAAALEQANQAQEQAEAALAEQSAQGIVLEQQLAALTSATAKTVAEYEVGVEERRKAEEARLAAEAAARAAAAAEAAASGRPGPSASGWSSPLANHVVSDEFGQRFHPIALVWRLHAGIDLVAGGGTCGKPVYSAAAGTVTQAGYNGGLGYSVTISHGGGLTTVYGHNSSLNVGRGQAVGGGEVIAFAGTTGTSTGCHVHFETRVDGSPENPRNYVAF
ncbi:peptidoglycan DD-metalloendopeptidase family protein [Herbiconiux sp. 11R-BC]|uniref:M23 family metallopeptidase n=1 Tax=Herbiconiux sp. 11R-BC TaxID=3111637 RepID=UPI003C0ADB65